MSKKANLRNRIRRLIRNWAVPVGCGLFFLFLLQYVFFIGYVPSASMEPTIKEGSLIIGTRLAGDLQRGDVVVFERGNVLMVKRIAGIPGDVVVVGNKTVAVPEDSYYLLGDNEALSCDSRYWDEPFVAKDQVIARVIIFRQRPDPPANS